MNIHFAGLPTAAVARIKSEDRDAYGLPLERHTADGGAIPCRHCLSDTPAGSQYLILAHRPFAGLNAYTETGPIFLCAADCPAPERSDRVPPMLRSPRYIVRGYSGDERIVYGTGQVVDTPDIPAYAAGLLDNPAVAFVDVRSASNNCFQCRILGSGD